MLSVEPIRYTPAGLPLLSLVLQHASEVLEAGLQRKVNCEINAVVIGDLANTPIAPNTQLQIQGFLAKPSAKSTQLILHIQQLKII